jgi:hypothetical protein
MAYEDPHKPFETIHSADIDRIHQLMIQGILMDPFGLHQALRGQIGFADLTPELQALLSPVQSVFSETGDGGTTTWDMGDVPLSNSEDVYLNGQRQERNDTLVRDYFLSGSNIIFNVAPMDGDRFTVTFKSPQSLAMFKIGDYDDTFVSQYDIVDMQFSGQDVIVLGYNRSTGLREVAKYRASDMVLQGVVSVDPGVPYAPNFQQMVLANDTLDGPCVWAVGSVSGVDYVSKIRLSDMTLLQDVNVAPTVIASEATSIITDGVKIYVFMLGGSTTPNSVVLVNADGAPTITAWQTGLTVVTGVTMQIALSGDLYISYESILSGAGQVRRYDALTGTLKNSLVCIKPIRLATVLNNIYILDTISITQSRIRVLSSTDIATTLITYPYVVSDMKWDGYNLWLASGDTMYKNDKLGSFVENMIPIPALNIRNIGLGVGSAWISYVATSAPPPGTEPSISRYFPGIPSI